MKEEFLRPSMSDMWKLIGALRWESSELCVMMNQLIDNHLTGRMTSVRGCQ